MRNRRIGALTLGIIFVAFGVLFLANNISDFPLGDILQWWPLILILLGLEVLLSSIINKKNQKFDVLSVFLILFILILTAGAGLAGNVMQGGSSLSYFGIKHYRFDSNFTKDFSIPAQGKTKLLVSNSFGNVTLEKSSNNEVGINSSIQISNNDENYAKQLSEGIISVEVTKDNIIEVTTRLPVNRDTSLADNIRTNYKISIPEGIEVDIQNRFGEITAANISDSMILKNEHGGITAENISGPIKAENSFGKITLENITGSTEADLKQGNLTVNNVHGSVNASNQFGQIDLNDITGDTQAYNKNGSIEIDGISGNLSVENSFGEIKVANVSGKLQLSGKNGNISVDYTKPASQNITIDNKFGNVTLSLPSNQTGHFKAYTKLGSIQSNFGSAINKEPSEATFDHVIGSDNPEINLTNSNGSIYINKV